MRRFIGLVVIGTVLAWTGGLGPAWAAILYTAEGDSGQTITDKLTTDGAQNPTVNGSVSVVHNPLQAAFGSRYILFPNNPTVTTTLDIPNTSSLGSAFTLAVMADESQDNLARLFSSFYGAGPYADELLFDIDATGNTLPGKIRGIVNGVVITPSVGRARISFGDNRYHHFAMTYNNGQVRLFLDGKEVARGTAGSGAVNLTYNLRFGEDYSVPPYWTPTTNEPFEGRADDILVLQGQALSNAEIRSLALLGAEAFYAGARINPYRDGILYTAEEDAPGVGRQTDKLLADGPQNAIFHNNVTVNTDPANARFGSGSFYFGDLGQSGWNTIELPDSAQLGDAFTLAAFINDRDNDGTRLFSAFTDAPNWSGDFLFDFDPRGDVLPGKLRVLVNGTIVNASTTTPTFADDLWHHLAMTYDNGQVRLYLDGTLVGSGVAGSGPVNLNVNLLFGEDPPGTTANEQFFGYADDILLLRRALTPEEIAVLAGASYLAMIPEPSSWILMGVGVLALGIWRLSRGRSGVGACAKS